MEKSKLERINVCLSYLRLSNIKINEIRISDSESKNHQEIKKRICKNILDCGKSFVTEAIFKIGLRADIVVLDDFKVIEIVVSESKESLLRKKREYNKIGFSFEVVYL